MGISYLRASLFRSGKLYRRGFGFSINEGSFPNIHMQYNMHRDGKFFCYIALTQRLRWSTTKCIQASR